MQLGWLIKKISKEVVGHGGTGLHYGWEIEKQRGQDFKASLSCVER